MKKQLKYIERVKEIKQNKTKPKLAESDTN